MLGTFLSIGGRGVHAGQIVVSEQRTLHANAPGDLFFANIYTDSANVPCNALFGKPALEKLGIGIVTNPLLSLATPSQMGLPPSRNPVTNS